MIVARSEQSVRCRFWLADQLPPQVRLQYLLWSSFHAVLPTLCGTADAWAFHRRVNANAQSSLDSRQAHRERLGISSLQALLGEAGFVY